MNDNKKMFWIKLPFWLGIGVDAFWAVALLIPSLFGLISGDSNFDPDLQTRQFMAIGGVMITGWTVLLLWAVRKPIERRFVILITAFPVVIGLTIVAFVGVLNGSISSIVFLLKGPILFVTMISGYILSGKVLAEKNFEVSEQAKVTSPKKI